MDMKKLNDMMIVAQEMNENWKREKKEIDDLLEYSQRIKERTELDRKKYQMQEPRSSLSTTIQGSVMCGECMEMVLLKKIRMCLDCCKLSDITETSRLICASCCLEGSHAGHTTLLHSVVQSEFREISEGADSLNPKRQKCTLLAESIAQANADTHKLFQVSGEISGQSLSEIKKAGNKKLREEEEQKLTNTMDMMKKFLLLSSAFHDKFEAMMTCQNVSDQALKRETAQISDIMSKDEQMLEKRLVVFTRKPRDDISGSTFAAVVVSPEETVDSLCGKLEKKHNLTNVRGTVRVDTEDGKRLTTGTMVSNGVKDMTTLTLSRIRLAQAYALASNSQLAKEKAELEERGSTAEPPRVRIALVHC